MKASEFRELSTEDLKDKISSLEENLFRLRCNRAVGQLEDKCAIRVGRRDIARAKTILRQKLVAQ